MSDNILPNNEATFIQKYLAPLTKGVAGACGLTDDAAAVQVPAGHEVVASVDAVTAGVHFFETDKPADIAWSAVAVNVSDLVAKGAQPNCYLMALTFPTPPEADWMTGFRSGLGAAQSTFQISLVGGDTDVGKGPLSVTITALGFVPQGKMVLRSGANPGDLIYMTGTIGDAGAGLALRRAPSLAQEWQVSEGDADFLRNRSQRPRPHVRGWPLVQSYASASIDLSDGLVKDAQSLAAASGCGFRIACADLPISQPARQVVACGGVDARALLTAGGDYEMLLTVPAQSRDAFEVEAGATGVPVTQIGTMTKEQNTLFVDAEGAPITFESTGYDHFR